MKWTKQQPTAEGWYWVKDPTFPAMIIEVEELTDGGVTQLYAHWINHRKREVRCDIVSVFNDECEYYGPILPPLTT